MKYGRPLTLKQHRQIAGYSQETFANKLGVDRVTVWAWEQGTRTPRAKTVANIEKVLGISWADDVLMHKE